MTTAPTGEKAMNSSDRTGDDLTVITGIDSGWQRKLGEVGIRTLQDLAEISDDKIEAVAAEIKGISVNMIKKWRTEARERLSSQQAIKPPKLEGEDAANSAAEEDEWEYIAAFIVEFKVLKVEGQEKRQAITVTRMGIDKAGIWKDAKWMGDEDREPKVVEGERLYPWMLEQMGEKAPWESEKGLPVEARPAAAAPPTAAPPVKVEVTQICAFQPPQAETPTAVSEAGQLFSGFFRSGEPFALEASFELVGPAVAEVAKKQVTYRTQFYARNRSTGERLHPGDTKPDTLVKGKSSYTATLPEEVILQPGVYRLWVFVTLQGIPPNVGYLEVPLLQVV